MTRVSARIFVCTFLLALYGPLAVADDADRYWAEWRGPLGTGVGPQADPPVEWSEDKNVRWKTPLPGKGLSTPIVWGDRIFITTAVPYEKLAVPIPDNAPGGHDNLSVTHRQEFVVLAVNRADGTILWRRTVNKKLPHEGGHNSGSFASHSPVTDGESVFAFFGSYGLYCLDVDGELKWKKDFGKMATVHGHGEGSSPVLHGDTLVVNWDHEGQSFVIAFDKRGGKRLWRMARDEITSWATPIVVEHGGGTQVVVSGANRLRGYDLSSGKIIWECGGLSKNVVATPVSADGIVYAGSSYVRQAMIAVRLDGAKGDITGSDQVVWERNRSTPYVPSPLLYGDWLYFLRHYQGIMSRVIAKTGKESRPPFRLHGIRNAYASPVGAADRVYVTDRDGTTLVIRHSDTPTVLALNTLDERIDASAALVGRELFLRGDRSLYCIAASADK